MAASPENRVLFSPYTIGRIDLENRIVMAPLTRSRAPGYVPNDSMREYYSLRSSAGLIITEGTSPSPNGLGYPRIPGCYTAEQGKGWQKVTDAVRMARGHIFLQIMHTGRVSHPLNMPEGAKILAPSAVGLTGQMWTDQKQNQPYPVPKEMTLSDIKDAIEEYAACAKLAIASDFDGVELHGANGYLIDQFLNPASNKRTDQYGGSIENRIRFAVEVAEATVKAIGGGKVGIRVSPYGAFNDMTAYPELEETYGALASKLSDLKLAYMHIVDHSSMGAPEVKPSVKALIRKNFKQAIILSGGYDAERAEKDLVEGKADLIAFGRPFISNPHLVDKLRTGAPLTAPDPATFYTPGDKGYIDYPVN